MKPKPKQWSPQHAAVFKDRGIVEAYHQRPPYPSEVFDLLEGLTTDEPRAVLDAGCGTGDIARHLVDRVGRVDAVDFSPLMIERAKQLPNGDHPHIRWIDGPMETVELRAPYSLITAGESLHWMDWTTVFPRFVKALTKEGQLAIIARGWGTGSPDEIDIFSRYSINQDFQRIDLVEELEDRSFFQAQGERRFGPFTWSPTVDEYIEARHSQNGFSRERMGSESVKAFGDELRSLLETLYGSGPLKIEVSSRVIWGEVAAGQ